MNNPIMPKDIHQGCHWYALYTRHQHEKTVAEILTAKGFEVFLPLYDVSHQWKDRVKKLSLPLFPSYVFLRSSLDHRAQILSTSGVHDFVGVEGRAARIPDEEIAAVRRTVDSLLHLEPYPFLRWGDWVRIKSGPLEGIEGILIRRTNQFRLVLSVEMLEQSVAVEVDPQVVEPVTRRVAPHTGQTRSEIGSFSSENRVYSPVRAEIWSGGQAGLAKD